MNKSFLKHGSQQLAMFWIDCVRSINGIDVGSINRTDAVSVNGTDDSSAVGTDIVSSSKWMHLITWI